MPFPYDIEISYTAECDICHTKEIFTCRVQAFCRFPNPFFENWRATTKTRIPMPVNMGLILLRLTIIFDEFGKDKTSSIGWWFDPTLGSPWMVNLGVE